MSLLGCILPTATAVLIIITDITIFFLSYFTGILIICFLWVLPPAAVQAAIEEGCQKSYLKSHQEPDHLGWLPCMNSYSSWVLLCSLLTVHIENLGTLQQFGTCAWKCKEFGGDVSNDEWHVLHSPCGVLVRQPVAVLVTLHTYWTIFVTIFPLVIKNSTSTLWMITSISNRLPIVTISLLYSSGTCVWFIISSIAPPYCTTQKMICSCVASSGLSLLP
jgi:hypothetical protein